MLAHRLIISLRESALRKVTRHNFRLTSTQTFPADSTWRPFGVDNFQPSHASQQQNAYRMTMDKKRKPEDFHASKRRKIDKVSPFLPEGSNDEVINIEVAELLARASLTDQNDDSKQSDAAKETNGGQAGKTAKVASAIELQKEIELDIVSLSSTGDGLAFNSTKDHIVVVPFSVPGDRVLAKIYRSAGRHSFADFVKVITPSAQREGITPECQYFGKCSGCQFQMLPYETQLEHKRGIVKKAFEHFSGMQPEQIPHIEPTMGSPLQYRYRTKLSPHFSRPFTRKPKAWDHIPNIGYNIKGRRDVMDIESCPIGTDIVQEGLKVERERVKRTIQTFKNGATILLRESTDRKYHQESPMTDANGSKATPVPTRHIPSNPLELDLQSTTLSHSPAPKITNVYPTHTDIKSYTSDETSLATEYVTVTTDPTTTPPATRTYKFTNTAGSFFQNNNSVLGPFTSYIYSQCLPKPDQQAGSKADSATSPATKPIKYLLDAYSGSGLFTLTLSPLFTSSLGIDIDARSISAARANASANALTNTTGFISADAAALFADVPYPSAQTLLVIDPPRKGCDRAFLKQLRRFGPRRVVYVSCNVHSQARDVGVLVNGFTKRASGAGAGIASVPGSNGNQNTSIVDEEWEEEGLWKYTIERIRGFDFFPQTGHVEGVCILNRLG